MRPYTRVALAIPISISRPMPGDRLRDFSILAGLLLWLAYTRVYWVLHVGHMTLPPCPFYYLTGHPCPFCGGTRSFAYMWQGDISNAVRLYPLGPALFAGSLVAVAGVATGIVSGRTWALNLSSRQWKLLCFGAVTIVALSWALKVFVLGN
jgi:Protein of unknown function (DUF2752)